MSGMDGIDPEGMARQFRRAPMLAQLRPLVVLGRVVAIDQGWRHRGLDGCLRLYGADGDGAEVRWGGRALGFGGDTLVVVPPQPPIDTRCTRPLQHFFIHAELPELPPAALAPALPEPVAVRLDAPLRALRDACWAGAERDEGDARWALRSTAFTAAVLAQALDLRAWTPTPGRLDGVVFWLRERLHRPISDSELARIYGTGRDACIRAFRRDTGLTPQAFIAQERLRRVADLLRSSDEPVAAIARRCGFPDPLYCTRRFTRAYGCPPTAWRRRAREADARR